MTRLADETDRAARDADAIDLARSWVDGESPSGSPDLGWVVAPEIALKLVEGSHGGSGSVLRNLPRTFARSVIGRTGPVLTSIGPVMTASSSIQHDRVFLPIIESLVTRHGAAQVGRLPRLRLGRFPGVTRSAARSLADIAASVGGRASPDAFGAMISQSAALTARAHRLFGARTAPKVLLVATQHGAAIRSLIRAAVDSGTTTVVYIPHAPMADNPWYHDIPTHRALLRGPAEIEVYGTLGVHSEHLLAVGDPSVPDTSWAPDAADPSSACDTKLLYAVSTDDVDSVRADVALMVAAGGGDVEVAMHPRLRDRDDLRTLFPPGWSFNPMPSTFERMRTARPAAVVQHGSGVGLEALSLGLPVIDLCNPGRTPNYHYLRPPHVAVVSDSHGLSGALGSIVHDSVAREERRSYAHRWMCAVGTQAVASLCEELDRILDGPVPSSVLLDGWRTALSGGVTSGGVR